MDLEQRMPWVSRFLMAWLLTTFILFWLWAETIGPWKSFVLANSTYALGLEASDGLAVDQVYQGSGLEG